MNAPSQMTSSKSLGFLLKLNCTSSYDSAYWPHFFQVPGMHGNPAGATIVDDFAIVGNSMGKSW